MINDDEIGKYRKKTKSNTSKSKSKADHKHEYADCLLYEYGKKNMMVGTFCKICGKIENWTLPVERGDGFYRMLSTEETLIKYRNLPQFGVNSFWDKYVGLGGGE